LNEFATWNRFPAPYLSTPGWLQLRSDLANNHESGPYPDIGIAWDGPLPEPWEWIAKAQEELPGFDDR